MTVFGVHASHEQISPRQLLADVQLAEQVGFTAAMCSISVDTAVRGARWADGLATINQDPSLLQEMRRLSSGHRAVGRCARRPRPW